MNPFSFPVLAGAALVSSPALWGLLAGQARLDVALTRYLVAVALCWAALSVVAMLVGPPQQEAREVAPEGAGKVPPA